MSYYKGVIVINIICLMYIINSKRSNILIKSIITLAVILVFSALY
jgi:Cu/Ag efflux pump CusA